VDTVDTPCPSVYCEGMELQFTVEEEARLVEIAAHSGKLAEQLVKGAALEILENDARFRAAVRQGIEAADRGDFIEEEEMEARIEKMLQS